MSVRFDAAADRLLRTTDLLNYNAAYTWMAWAHVGADPGSVYGAIFRLKDAVNNVLDAVDFHGGNNTFVLFTQTLATSDEKFTAANSWAVGNWYHVCKRRNSATSIDLLIGAAQSLNNTVDVSGRSAATRMENGGEDATDQYPLSAYSARIAYQKAWTRALSDAQINTEKGFIDPVDKANIYGWWETPDGANRVNDFSTNARHFTAGGALTDEANPPGVIYVPSPARRAKKIFLPAPLPAQLM